MQSSAFVNPSSSSRRLRYSHEAIPSSFGEHFGFVWSAHRKMCRRILLIFSSSTIFSSRSVNSDVGSTVLILAEAGVVRAALTPGGPMTRPFYAYLLAILVAPFVFSQTPIVVVTPQDLIRTGFAVVTPVTGGGLGLAVSETFAEQAGGTVFQATVLPSPLTTVTSVVVNTNPATGANTGVAIVNPNDAAATVTLTLVDRQGNPLRTSTLTMDGRQQIPRFVT